MKLMIKNEIFNGKDLPDEKHEEFIKLYDQISDALFDVAMDNSTKDDRIFLSALTVIHSGLLAMLIDSLEGLIDVDEYLSKEREVFEINFKYSLKRIKDARANGGLSE